ncbi:ABC transporter permease [Candidatus Poribacteria bacterium]|jgi:ABC-type lipoprotein release transport system permease subunit|nr:ABC transporter permease [Candidatus Poribacteria bacterium]MBT5534804.1 ABC transporter permease [Candidatus Poribacteria bacterium]MBT5714429.1 ABC transporter permease [Candidatus Poribacteria bacterium]MBT7101818.1 ABC transporter permease [Candidatus Poribacteria bacterium]MBT7807560.1 ABC transporter permease [Candidatus Poribacteria bacterium]
MSHLRILMALVVRNLIRNKRRTLLASLAVGVGLAALIFTDGFMLSMEENMIRVATATFLGDGQIHAAGYRESLDAEKYMPGSDALLGRLDADPNVAASAPRTQAFAMVSSTAHASSALLFGIDPTREANLSKVDDAIVDGDYLDGEPRRILVGRIMAEDLQVDVGDRVVVTLSEVGTDELAQAMFRVGGIFEIGVREMDRSVAFVPIDRARELLAIGDGAHEIAISLDASVSAPERVWDAYSTVSLETLGWPDLMPQLAAALGMTDISILFVAMVLLGVVALGIVNTLFMSLHERMFEFGVLRAVGTRPTRMAVMVLMEAGVLSLVSMVVGSMLAVVVCAVVNRNGIDYGGIEYAGVTFQEPLRAILELRQFVIYPLWVLACCFIAGLYPAVYAARMAPSSAMKAYS